MDPLVTFTLPIKGLSHGVHSLTFDVSEDFFGQFEGSPIENGKFEVLLELDKRIDMLILDFNIRGKAFTQCDRCLADIKLPLSGENRLLVKFGEEEESDDDADVVFIEPETHQFNIAGYVYEFICLAMPMIKVYDCQKDIPPPCDLEMLNYLEQQEPETNENNPFKEALKNLTNTTGKSFPK